MSASQSLAAVLGAGIVSALGRGLAAHAEAQQRPPAAASRVTADELEPGRRLPYRPVVSQLAFAELVDQTVGDALAEAEIDVRGRPGVGLFLGSSSLDIGICERDYAAALAAGEEPDAPMAQGRSGYGSLADAVAGRFGIEGPSLTVNTACSSSANAALYAARMIQSGELDYAVVLGTEDFNRLSLLGFASLMLVTEEQARPFDAGRDGLVLGEGVAALVLGRPDPRCPFHLDGGANLCDTSSATNASPQSIAQVMREALAEAGVARDAVAAVKAHGTSTPSNDQAEGQGMRQLFGDALPPFTSLKGHLGHTLGACGAIEMAALMACLRAGFLPATAGFRRPDPELGITPLRAPAAARAGSYLLNFFGFGGNNTSLVLRWGG